MDEQCCDVEKSLFYRPAGGVCCCPLKSFLHIRLSVWLLVMALADHAAAVETPFAVDVWGTADGLPQSSVIAITQARNGYLWLGTLNGLVRFDGNSFTPFNVNNTPGLPNNLITFLFEDSRTNLWVGTDNAGLCMIQNGLVKNFDTTGAGGNFTYAFEDATGAVWFSALGGNIFCWQNGRLEMRTSRIPDQFSLEVFNRSKHVQVPGKNGIVWQLQNGRVEKLTGEKSKTDLGASPWASALVPLPFKTSSGYLALITIDAYVTATGVDPDGNLVVGTHGAGIYWADGQGGWRHITTGENSPRDFVLSICFDRDGNLWAGTDGGGLYRVKKNYFNTPASLPDGVAKSVAEDASGGLWVAFNAHGLAYALSNAVNNFAIGQGSNAWSVLVDRQQQVWAGTRGEGLFRLASGKFQPVSEAGKIGSQIFTLLQGRDGKLWVGGENGLGGFDGQSWNYFSVSDGLPPNNIRALAEDAKGGLLIGTDGGGLFQLRDGKISAVNAPAKDISCLLVDRDDVLWVGTSGHGLARFQNGIWSNYSTINGGLGTDNIGYMIDDDAGNLWLGSYEGLLRVEKKSLADTLSVRTFLTRECSAGAQPAAIRTHDGRLWFPTIEGLVAVNPADLKPSTNPPPVVIESVFVDGARQNTNLLGALAGGAVTLTPDNEQLDIQFTSLDFSASKGAQSSTHFKYRLEKADEVKHDESWTDAGTERVAHFPKLQPGKYIFHVKAGNEDGFWNNTGATLAVIVEPPFWRKPWFLALVALCFIGVLAGVIYLISTAKLKRQLRVARQKELIEKERARIARDLHDQLGANLTQVMLLGELAEVDKHLPEEIEQHAQQITETARDTTRALDEIVWAVNPSNDTLEGLANYACKYAQDYFALAGVSFRSELPTHLPAMPILPEVRHNVFLAFKEAVNNVVKHAKATEARVKLQLGPERFILTVADNGRGLGDVSGKSLRNGMKNMRKRLADVRGEFEITPGANGGTLVKLIVPLNLK